MSVGFSLGMEEWKAKGFASAGEVKQCAVIVKGIGGMG